MVAGGFGFGVATSGTVSVGFASEYSSTSIFVNGDKILFFSLPTTNGRGRVKIDGEADPRAYLTPSWPPNPPVFPKFNDIDGRSKMCEGWKERYEEGEN